MPSRRDQSSLRMCSPFRMRRVRRRSLVYPSPEWDTVGEHRAFCLIVMVEYIAPYLFFVDAHIVNHRPTPLLASLLLQRIADNMLQSTLRRPSIPVRSWLAPNSRAGSSRIALPSYRTFYSDLYENEGHLFDLHRDDSRPTVTPSPFNSNARSGAQQQQSRFSTSHGSAYEVERQMQKVSISFDSIRLGANLS